MLIEEVLVVEGDVADDAEAVRDDSCLIGVAEMPVDVKLFDVFAGGGAGRHGSVSRPVRAIRTVEALRLCIGFEPPDDGVRVFRIVLGDIGLDAGGVENGHARLCGVDGPADGFGQVNERLKERGQATDEILFEAGDAGGVRYLMEAAELPQVF